MFRNCCVALPHDVTGMSAVCDCGISRSYYFWFVAEIYKLRYLQAAHGDIISDKCDRGLT